MAVLISLVCHTCWNGSECHKTAKCQTLPKGICITHTCLVWISPLLTHKQWWGVLSRGKHKRVIWD